MAPIIKVSDEVLKGLDNLRVAYELERAEPTQRNEQNETSLNLEKDFIKLPSGIYVAKEKTLHGKNWFDSHKALQEQGKRMLIPLEFVEFLKYTRENFPEIYRDVTEVRSPWRAEHLDAYFEKRKDGLYILTGNKTKEEKLDEDTLMEDRIPGISLDDYIDRAHTSQGLPRRDVKKGNLYFWHPRNVSVASFLASDGRANLLCVRYLQARGFVIGVRAVAQEK